MRTSKALGLRNGTESRAAIYGPAAISLTAAQTQQSRNLLEGDGTPWTLFSLEQNQRLGPGSFRGKGSGLLLVTGQE